MQYRVWDSGVIRDATPEELEELARLPRPDVSDILESEISPTEFDKV